MNDRAEPDGQRTRCGGASREIRKRSDAFEEGGTSLHAESSAVAATATERRSGS
ncbi:MAG TPA: hypothetical protein VIV57_22805 [Anaeromyxobacter sp.]